MKIKNITEVFFSATYTTKKIIKTLSAEFGGDLFSYDITNQAIEYELYVPHDDLLIIGMPVYSGRIPSMATKSLQMIKGKDTPAIIVCVYGNRNYDDALLELKETLQSNGFKIIAAGAFIARHSIFQQIASLRPDQQDMSLIKEFALETKKRIEGITEINSISDIQVKGNHPYKIPKKIPLAPKGDKKECSVCGSCVNFCPTQAIEFRNPWKTDKNKCIACGRCIVICPEKTRKFRGILYNIAKRKFIKAYSERKMPTIIFYNE